jgi:hypothetical protein
MAGDDPALVVETRRPGIDASEDPGKIKQVVPADADPQVLARLRSVVIFGRLSRRSTDRIWISARAPSSVTAFTFVLPDEQGTSKSSA